MTTQPDVGKDLENAGRSLAEELAAKIPADAKVAVLPFVDSEGGVRRVGAMLAEEVQRSLLASGRNVLDRDHMNVLLDEIDLQLALASDSAAVKKASALAEADVLVVGDTTDAGSDFLCSVRALRTSSGQVLAQSSRATLERAPLGRLLWYVRRPASQSAAGELPPLALRYEFISSTPAGEVRLDSGAAVRSGQQFRVRVQPNSDCYLYLLLYDSQGQPSVLFPHAEIGGSNQVRGGVVREFPAGTKWYYFDRTPGEETFYLVASYTPLTDLDAILSQMRQAGPRDLAAAARKEIDGTVTRGMSAAGSKNFGPKGYSILDRGVGVVDLGWGEQTARQQIDDVVIGCATVVKRLTLRHQE